MKFGFLVFFLLLISFGIQAQNKIINGVLFDESSTRRVSGAKVVNLANNQLTKTDGLGLFSILAAPGDTVKITKEGFTDQILRLSSYQDLVIRMFRPVQLSEVRVVAQSKKTELDEIKRQYRRKGSYHAGKPPLLSYIFTPLTAIYELIGKTPGQARRFNRFYSRELQQSEIDRRFNSSTVKPLTTLEGQDLQNFMQTYRPDFAQLSGWADYDLVKYIRKSVLAFEADGRPEVKALPKLPKAPDLSEKIIIKD